MSAIVRYMRYSMGELALNKDKKFFSTRDIGQLIALTVVIFLLLKVFFVLAFVPTGSMEPTIKEKSAVIGWRLSYLLSDPLPDRGEIIIFDHEEFNKHLVKRVVGLPGDEVLISDGQVYVNSEKLDEPYLAEMDSGEHDGQFTVPEGKLLVLGDNRNHSNDSRFWVNPFVDVEKVYAKVLIWLQLPHL